MTDNAAVLLAVQQYLNDSGIRTSSDRIISDSGPCAGIIYVYGGYHHGIIISISIDIYSSDIVVTVDLNYCDKVSNQISLFSKKPDYGDLQQDIYIDPNDPESFTKILEIVKRVV